MNRWRTSWDAKTDSIVCEVVQEETETVLFQTGFPREMIAQCVARQDVRALQLDAFLRAQDHLRSVMEKTAAARKQGS